jgi:hypothetical protein
MSTNGKIKPTLRTEEWQRAQSWGTAQDLTLRDVPEATLDDLRSDAEVALARAVHRRRDRG